MSSGGGHGPQGSYPDTWDKETRSKVPEPEGSAGEATESETGGSDPGLNESLDGGSDVGTFADPGEADETPVEQLEIADGPADARTYNCGECDSEVSYLQDCPEGHDLQWWDSEVTA